MILKNDSIFFKVYQVLYPLGVDRSVEDDPLPLLGVGRGHVAEGATQHAVRPLVGVRVKDAVQLSHRDRLRVDDFVIRSKFLKYRNTQLFTGSLSLVAIRTSIRVGIHPYVLNLNRSNIAALLGCSNIAVTLSQPPCFFVKLKFFSYNKLRGISRSN